MTSMRSRRCVISDKSTRKAAFGSGFLGQKGLPGEPFIVERPTPHSLAISFVSLPATSSPVTHLRTLDMFGSERHKVFSSILRKAAFLLSDIGPKALVNKVSPVRGGVESIYCRSKLIVDSTDIRTPRGGIGGSVERETFCVFV